MAKRRTKTLYYARKVLLLQKKGERIGWAHPGDLVDVEALGLTRGEVHMMVEDRKALRAVEVDEDAEPDIPPVPDSPADSPGKGSD